MPINSARLIERYENLKQHRDSYWLNVWREVRRYVYPNFSDYKTEGGTRGDDTFDSTPVEARKRLAAGIFNWMAPPDKRWFELVPASDELAKDEDVKDYFSEVTKLITHHMANSNWASVLIMTLNDLACGLDGVIYAEDGGRDSVLNFRSFPIETVVYQENSKGRVDTVFREISMTARQIVLDFGEKDLPADVLTAVKDEKKQDESFVILHAVFPRMNRDPKMRDNKNMPFVDVYIEKKSKKVIYESGFEEFPYAVCRFEKANNESYGRGPGLDKLPDIRMLNRMRQVLILGNEHAADPSWLVPDGSITDKNFNKNPGQVHFYKVDPSGAKPEQLISAANVNQLAATIEAERDSVRKGFFWDIFDPLGDLKGITATEAEIRNEGKMIPFAPIAGNLHNELFRVIIHRAYGLIYRRGLLPPIPDILLSQPDYKIEFVSKIALSIKKLESLGWLQTEASIANISTVKPDVMDNFELDDVARDIALVNGSSPKWLRPVRERDALRDMRAQQQAAAEQQAMLAQGASLAPDLAKAPEPGSVLESVMRGGGI